MTQLTGGAVKALITWLLVVLGWMVVSDQQAAREFAKNCYERMQRLREELCEIEDLAIQHHTASFDELRAKKVLRLISQISMEIEHWRKVKCLGIEVIGLVVGLRRAVSIENFDCSSYAVQALDSEIVVNIEIAKNKLDRALMDAAYRAVRERPSLVRSVISSVKRIF